MCDPYRPSAVAAQNAFFVAFPSNKQTEAYKFGLKSIITVRVIEYIILYYILL